MAERTEKMISLWGEEEGAILWPLLVRQAERYTHGESTSVRGETAAALLASLRFSLDLYQRSYTEVPLKTLTPEELLDEMEKNVRRRTAQARMVYLRACRCAYQEESLALADTLRGIGIFFQEYDPRFFAAEIPCDIDYQLAQPVEESLSGVSYIRAWLDRLLTEDTVLRRFHPDMLRRIWAAVCPGHRELLVNLYEPIVTAALGVTLTEGSLFDLDITRSGQSSLDRLLRARTCEGRRALLLQAGETLVYRLDLGRDASAYVRRTAGDLVPRVEAVLAADEEWQPLFPAFS